MKIVVKPLTPTVKPGTTAGNSRSESKGLLVDGPMWGFVDVDCCSKFAESVATFVACSSQFSDSVFHVLEYQGKIFLAMIQILC